MNKKPAEITLDIFESKLTKIYGAFYILAAICAFGSIIFAAFSTPEIRQFLAPPDINSFTMFGTGTMVWEIIYISFMMVTVFWSCIMAVYSLSMYKKKYENGFKLVEKCTKITSKLIKISYTLVFVIFVGYSVFFIIKYVFNLKTLEAMLLYIFTTFFLELIMGTQAFFLHKFFKNYILNLEDACSMMSYTTSTQKVSYPSISAWTYAGLFFTGIFCSLFGVFQFISKDFIYGVVKNGTPAMITSEPLYIFVGSMILFFGLGNIVNAIYMKRYKSECELALYKANKMDIDI